MTGGDIYIQSRTCPDLASHKLHVELNLVMIVFEETYLWVKKIYLSWLKTIELVDSFNISLFAAELQQF